MAASYRDEFDWCLVESVKCFRVDDPRLRPFGALVRFTSY